jgi:signal transduction histidine kinase
MNLPRIRIGLPRSLVGRMVLLLGIALAIAQLANFGLILNERQKLSLAQNDGPAITRFAVAAADMAEADPAFREAMIADLSHRGARYAIRADSGIAEALRSEPTEARLAQNLRDLDRGGAEVRATAPRSQAANARPGAQPERFALSFAARLAAATLLLYALVLSATLLIARHLARPLKDLTEAAHGFRGRTVPATVTPRGPDDLRDAIEAFNAMNQRLAALLDEKDGMLGAIGHDLRTPLASLRIRLESMDPPEERAAAVRKVEEMAGTLEDILALASSGRQRETIRPTDITALVETVVEEFQDLGAEVQWSPAGRQVLPAQPGQLKRAVQNLIANAVKYGGGARVSVVSTSGALLIEVADDGPGIAADELEQVMRPFYRIENSRNRETGGTGLGLAITKAIAESHGGMLTLETSPNGLTARISLPR